jgi:hypothetical protein
MDDHFQGLGKPPYSEQRGETGNGGVAGTIKAIIAEGSHYRIRDWRQQSPPRGH